MHALIPQNVLADALVAGALAVWGGFELPSAAMGDEYRQYPATTSRLIPWVW